MLLYNKLFNWTLLIFFLSHDVTPDDILFFGQLKWFFFFTAIDRIIICGVNKKWCWKNCQKWTQKREKSETTKNLIKKLKKNIQIVFII